MGKQALLIILGTLNASFLFSQNNIKDTTRLKKTGWLVYRNEHVIWFESDLKNNTSAKYFFTPKTDYTNGLVVDYIPIAKFYKSIAKCYSIKALSHYDTISKKSDYVLSDSICILPVKANFTRLKRPVSELLQPMGFSFKESDNEVTITYNFEANYDITEIELMRKKDKRKIRRVKNYVVYPPH